MLDNIRDMHNVIFYICVIYILFLAAVFTTLVMSFLWYKVWKTSSLIYPYKSFTYHYRNISYVRFAVVVRESFVLNIEHLVGTRDGKKEAQKIDMVWTGTK